MVHEATWTTIKSKELKLVRNKICFSFKRTRMTLARSCWSLFLFSFRLIVRLICPKNKKKRLTYGHERVKEMWTENEKHSLWWNPMLEICLQRIPMFVWFKYFMWLSINLAGFLKTSQPESATISMKRRQKARLLHPISPKITQRKEKEREKRESKEKERRRREKAMVALLVFILVDEMVYQFDRTFWKIQLEIYYHDSCNI